MSQSNPRPFTQFVSRADSGKTPESKPGDRKPGKAPHPVAKSVHFEAFDNRAYAMSYACLLIPRDPEHLLSGKVADFIQKTLQNVCIAFGWQLSRVKVEPQFFQWVVSAKVGTPPSKCIQTIREETSKGILAAFSELRPADEFADFWAPGYLVLVGEEPHSPAIIQEFIRLTRQQQALSRRTTGQDSDSHA